MSAMERFCPNCGTYISSGSNNSFCSNCGEELIREKEVFAPYRSDRVVLKGKKPKKREFGDGADFDWWEKEQARKKRYRVEKWTGREGRERLAFDGILLVSGGGVAARSPILLLLANFATLGLCSAFFTWNCLSVLNAVVRKEERVKYHTAYIWIFSHIAAAVLALWSALAYTALPPGTGITEFILSYYKPVFSLAYAIFAVILNRHILFWIREVLSERMSAEWTPQRRKPPLFAPSGLLLWYVGFPYVQFHINRAIKRRYLLRG